MTDELFDLLDQRAERVGITFRRKRVIDPFPTATAAQGTMLERLFAVTRPTGVRRKKRIREIAAEKAAAPQEPTERIDLPKGMVPYRRELYGTIESQN